MSHSPSKWARLAVLSFSVAGCGAAADTDVADPPPERAPRAAGQAPIDADPSSLPWQWQKITAHPLLPVPDLLAFAANGNLVVADGHTGVVRQSLAVPALAGARDLAYDAAQQRAWIASAGDAVHAGEVASYPVDAGASGPVLGAPSQQASLGGASARLLPAPGGMLLFADTGAGTWQALAGGGVAGAPSVGPRPMSAWITADAGGATVHGLAYGPSSGELDLARAAVGGGGVGPITVEPFGVDAGTVPPSARVVAAPARGGALLLDVSGSFLTVRVAAGAGTGAPALVPLGSTGQRIEAAASFEDGEVVTVLLSGSTALLAVEIDAQLHAASMAKVALPGQPAPSTRFLSHDLAAQGAGRVAAATSAGVFSLELWRDAVGVHLGLAPGFDGSGLRGPIAALYPAPH